MIPARRRADVSNETQQTSMMTSSNGNIFRVTGPLCGEFTGPGDFPTQRPVTGSFYVFFDLRLNKRLSKQPWGWWFETPSWSLWRHCNEIAATNPIAYNDTEYTKSPYTQEGYSNFELMSRFVPQWHLINLVDFLQFSFGHFTSRWIKWHLQSSNCQVEYGRYDMPQMIA